MDQVGLVVPNLHERLEHLEHLGHPLAPAVQENLYIRHMSKSRNMYISFFN